MGGVHCGPDLSSLPKREVGTYLGSGGYLMDPVAGRSGNLTEGATSVIKLACA